MKKIYLKLLLGIVFFVFLSDFCHKKTKGFQVGKIAAASPFDAQWEPLISSTLEEDQVCCLAINQPFRYLKKGKYCYVFISDDSRYVLKFFQSPKIEPPFFITWDWVRFLAPSFCEKIISQKNKQKESNFTSYKMAFDFFRKQNGMVSLHLNSSTHLKNRVILYDNIGIRHEVPIDSLAFILQKKADPFTSSFQALFSTQKEKAYALLTQFAWMLKERVEKGVSDWDLSPRYNLGVLNEELMAFDLDSLRYVGAPLDRKKHMMQDGKKMLIWLESNYSEAYFFLKEEIERIGA